MASNPRAGALVALALLATACTRDNGIDAADISPPQAGASDPTEAPAQALPPDKGTTTSPLAGQVSELDSAIYDQNEHAARTAAPSGLRIDTLGIRAATIVDVGVEDDGELEVPPASQVGWYRFGAAPGEAGTTVLAAHIAYNGVDGVFRHLADLRTGAIVSVEFSDGQVRRYEVTSVDEYDKQALPPEVWATDGPERLVLITCGGRFDPSRRSYESNIVAWATPVSP